MSRLAWITGDRQIATSNADGTDAKLLTTSFSRGFGSWSQLAPSQLTWSWPTWSPDATWVAGFVVEGSDDRTGPARVVAQRLDGSEEVVWDTGSDALPIYMQWRPDGSALAVLSQRRSELSLAVVAANRLGVSVPVEAGVPLFFSWTPDGTRLLVHTSTRGAPGGRIVLRDPLGDADDVAYDLPPGSFCAPVFVGSSAIWATPDDGGSLVYASNREGGRGRPLVNRKGLLALVPAPGGAPFLAMSNAVGGEGSPYGGIELIDLRDGTLRTLTRMECLAFFWSPTADWLLVAQVAADENCLRWWKVPTDGREPMDLGTFWPTREVVFYLHFFDQYTSSHPLVSADGRHVAFAGYPAGGGQADLSRPPRVYLKDVERPETPAAEVDGGSFAVFSA